MDRQASFDPSGPEAEGEAPAVRIIKLTRTHLLYSYFMTGNMQNAKYTMKMRMHTAIQSIIHHAYSSYGNPEIRVYLYFS